MGPSTIEPKSLAQITDPEVRRFLREHWATIEDKFKPIHFILFGSRITGTPHEWSDIDAILVSERFFGMEFSERVFLFKTSVQPHIAMDVLCYPPDEFEDLRNAPVGIVADACKEGIWLK